MIRIIDLTDDEQVKFDGIITDFCNCSDFTCGCEKCQASELLPDCEHTTYCDFLLRYKEHIINEIEKAMNKL